MDANLTHLSLRYAKLIISYTHNRLSATEENELDEWLESSDENLEIFEALTEGVDDNVFSADDLIIATDDLLDTWMIAGLIARQMQNIITTDEKRTLQNWVTESEHNKALYNTFTNKSNLQQFVTWFKQLMVSQSSPGLN